MATTSSQFERFDLKYRPPEDWERRLKKLAQDADLELGTTFLTGNQILYSTKPLLPLPGVPASPPDQRLQAFKEAALKMLEDPTLPRETLNQPPQSEILRSTPWVILGWITAGAALLSFIFRNQLQLPETTPALLGLISLLVSFQPSFIFNSLFGGRFSALQEALRRQEELFNRLSAAQSENATNSDLAKTTIIFRANSAKDDQARIWRRSNWAFGLGCFFFTLSLAGPIGSYWILTRINGADWHQFIPSLSISAIMLTAAAALLRYDGKLREHYQAKADEVAYLDRLQLAIDSARTVSDKTYKNTLRNIITQLVTAPPGLSTSNRPLTPEAENGAGDATLSIASKLINTSKHSIDTAAQLINKGRPPLPPHQD